MIGGANIVPTTAMKKKASVIQNIVQIGLPFMALPPAGDFAVYYKDHAHRPGWTKAADVSVPDLDLDIGLIELQTANLVINLIPQTPPLALDDVAPSLHKDQYDSPPIGRVIEPPDSGQPFVIEGVPFGPYFVVARHTNGLIFARRVLVDESEFTVNINIPDASASISGTVTEPVSDFLYVYNSDRSVITILQPEPDDSFASLPLVPGTYFVAEEDGFLGNAPPFTSFTLESGEHQTIDIDVSQ